MQSTAATRGGAEKLMRYNGGAWWEEVVGRLSPYELNFNFVTPQTGFARRSGDPPHRRWGRTWKPILRC